MIRCSGERVNDRGGGCFVFLVWCPAVVWMKTKLPLLLLFTFPATYSYLLRITPPRSVVTKTRCNPRCSAPHHTDRLTLAHPVGELADGSIYFPFLSLSLSPRVKSCVRLSVLGQKPTKMRKTENQPFLFYDTMQTMWCATWVEWAGVQRNKGQGVWKYPDGVGGLCVPPPVVFPPPAVQTCVPKVTSSRPETTATLSFHAAALDSCQSRARAWDPSWRFVLVDLGNYNFWGFF